MSMEQEDAMDDSWTNALTRLCLLVAFSIHLFVGAAYWWLSPKGFPYSHSRYWLNSLLPLSIVAVASIGLANLLRNRLRMMGVVAWLFAAGWLGGSIAGRILFPLSLRGFWGLGLMVAGGGFVCGWLSMRQQPLALGRYWLFTPLCTLAGVFVVLAQLPPPASTQPLGFVAPEANSTGEPEAATVLDLGDSSRYLSNTAELVLRRGKVLIRCSPLLSFDRISPDRFWSLLTPRNPSNRQLLSSESGNPGFHRYFYNQNQTVEIMQRNSDGPLVCTAWSTVMGDTYTHLNSYCVLVVEGHQELSLSFSPCPDMPIEILPADYPTGRPARMAYLTDQDKFVVVEASSGEKGPFRAIATGKLRRGDPLSICFYDNDEPLLAFTLEDWSQQLSTALSPTAGWGVPQNAIEFQRSDDNETSPVHIFITLAATSVGRGWETVGHRAGTYRNRLSFELKPPHHLSSKP